MILRFRETSVFWRIITLFIIPKYKADVYASMEETDELKAWLKFQGIKYTNDTSLYYSASSLAEAEKIKPKMTIHVRNEENMSAVKMMWC